ncbi:HAD family hydrolase [Rhizobiaceae bacterium n13]|uniref:HAD family hydrolase n=1 Tax=Ferirhizobium litorale TaxID=2927786 RepID=UPI0024B29152|nr:HAD family hydrolase [Fererhizobium litorale]MDI7862379.1 HAD family hydrolase [Fererhizobium litorale]
MLKGAIFSLSGVLVKEGSLDIHLLSETVKLLHYVRSRNVEPVLISNHRWTVTDTKGSKRLFEDLIAERLGSPIRCFFGGENGMPRKPLATATSHVLAQCGWSRREVVYVGNTETDMRTAANGKLLFLNAHWHGATNSYGFPFNSPLDIARFIDCFCLGLNGWFWALEKQGNLKAFALAPFTTLSSKLVQAHAYSADAKATSKDGAGNAVFWGRLLASSVYRSGLADEIDYITAYPGHAPNSKQTVIAEALNILGQSLRKSYLPDLIVRHTKAQKSQTTRAAGGQVGIENQINTIKLNKQPLRGLNGKPYVKSPLNKQKTVLVVDDFCTQGNSFEAARAFIDATGASVVCLGWLKTINTDYQALAAPLKISDPFSPVNVSTKLATVSYSYYESITSSKASDDLAAVHKRYQDWTWPT